MYSIEAYFFFLLLLAVGANRDLAVDEEAVPSVATEPARQGRSFLAAPSLSAQLGQGATVDNQVLTGHET